MREENQKEGKVTLWMSTVREWAAFHVCFLLCLWPCCTKLWFNAQVRIYTNFPSSQFNTYSPGTEVTSITFLFSTRIWWIHWIERIWWKKPYERAELTRSHTDSKTMTFYHFYTTLPWPIAVPWRLTMTVPAKSVYRSCGRDVVK